MFENIWFKKRCIYVGVWGRSLISVNGFCVHSQKGEVVGCKHDERGSKWNI